ncbi:MAG TPA: phytanoyl-CoA dioxygenase family protein [Polyangiaceae bacterium]|nr:phytanoyl-CoA dioxygenase family protein [Polyangiaceae bacterium]
MCRSPNPIASFHHDSFVILRNFLDRRACAELRQAADTVLAWSRAQCAETSHSTPRISLLTQATSFEHGAAGLAPILAFASSPSVCSLLQALAERDSAGIPQLKDAHYYHEQTKRDWDGDWHRDSQFSRSDPDLERELVGKTYLLHVRVALAPEADDRLELVPGSHARWDSEQELRIRRGSDRASAQMPGAVRAVLQAGDACLFHGWSIHRATYRRAPVRRTLDLLYGSAGTKS